MKFSTLFFLLFIAGCASWTKVSRIENVNRSLTVLRRAIQGSLPLGSRHVSEGGKRFESQYFVLGKTKFLKPLGAKIRYYADVSIRGDRRPYTIDITVIRQVKQRSSQASLESFKDQGTDQRIANLIKHRILKQLSKRREDLNIIDDFRVF